MYVCMYVCMYVYIYMYIYIYMMCMYIYIYYIYIYIHTCVWITIEYDYIWYLTPKTMKTRPIHSFSGIVCLFFFCVVAICSNNCRNELYHNSGSPLDPVTKRGHLWISGTAFVLSASTFGEAAQATKPGHVMWDPATPFQGDGLRW